MLGIKTEHANNYECHKGKCFENPKNDQKEKNQKVYQQKKEWKTNRESRSLD